MLENDSWKCFLNMPEPKTHVHDKISCGPIHVVFENGTQLEIVLSRMLKKHNKTKSISTYVRCTRTIMAIKENHSIRVEIN